MLGSSSTCLGLERKEEGGRENNKNGGASRSPSKQETLIVTTTCLDVSLGHVPEVSDAENKEQLVPSNSTATVIGRSL